MKGLLLKDLYCIKSYFRAFFLLDIVFIILPFFAENTAFFTFYPCILSGMIAMSIISYEEKEKWSLFAGTLPVSRRQAVSVKYIITLIFGMGTALVILAAQTVIALRGDSFEPKAILSFFAILLAMTLVPPAVLLPLVFKFGAEKGRIFYYLVLGGFCGALGALGGVDGFVVPQSSFVEIALAAVSVAGFAVSWLISLSVYKNKEL